MDPNLFNLVAEVLILSSFLLPCGCNCRQLDAFSILQGLPYKTSQGEQDNDDHAVWSPGNFTSHGTASPTLAPLLREGHHVHKRALSDLFEPSTFITRYIVVDQQGGGLFRTVQAAIDAIPENNPRWVYVQINAGVYMEKVTIPYNKPNIMLQGAGRTFTIITWNDRARSLGTADSATFSANAPSVIVRGIGFRNGAPPAAPGTYGGQAVAVLLTGDMMAFYQCGFYGAQDTLFDYQGRHYFKGCYIEGSIDFIFGHGQSTYKSCEIAVMAQSGYLSGSITAQNRWDPSDGSGFVFVDCSIRGTGEVYLGRAWGPYSRVIFLYTYMGNIVVPEGWFDWDNPSRQRTVYYGQYKCYGPGADTSRRVPWSRTLSDEEARPFLELSFIDGSSWLQEI